MQVKLLLVTFYWNGALHAISMGKPSERMRNFWTVRFFKNRIRTEFRFSAHPYLSARPNREVCMVEDGKQVCATSRRVTVSTYFVRSSSFTP